jgi:AraC-like DNA-binding protein
VLVTENNMHTEVFLKRLKKDPCHYILAFDDVRISKSMEQIVGGEKEYYHPPVYAGASLSSTMFDNVLIAARDFSFASIRIMFPPLWLAKFFKIDKEDDLMVEYLSLKTKKLTLAPLDMEYRKLMDDVFNVNLESPVYYATLENRVMLMMEKFFSQLEANLKKVRYKRLDKSDIYKMMQVESELSDRFLGGLPTAEALADKYGFSETKLKRLFREIYGYPLYEYYQRCRLERAREMLAAGGRSVKETGLAVGYKSLSNFSKAFKHVYGVLPGEIR